MGKTRMPRNEGYGHVSVHTVKLPLWPYLVTPISAIAALPATEVAYRFYGDSPWTGVVVTGSAMLVTSFTYWAARPRGPVMRAMATGIAAASSAWTIPAIIDGPFTKGMIGMWAAGTLVMTVVVAAQRILRTGESAEPAEPAMGGLIDRVKELKDVRFSRAKVTGGKAAVEVTMPPGATFASLPQDEIASVLDVAAPAVRMIRSDDSERRGRIEAVPVDQLKVPPPWTGPSAPGQSIAVPLLLGVVEDSEPLLLTLPGDPTVHRNSLHLGVVGMSGAGKTEVILRIAEEVLTRPNAELWIGDARKADQLPRWLLDGAARVAGTEPDVDELLDDLLDDVPVRSKQMGSHGHKQWMDRCSGCPRFRVVLLDEAAQVAANNRVFVDLAESLRSVGVSLIVGLQRASHDRFPTSARSNIGAWICLGVKDEEDAGMALSEEMLAAGAMPWRWKAGYPGYLYADVPGVPVERSVLQARSFAPPPSEDDRASAIAAVTGGPEPRRPPPPSSPATPTPAPAGDEDQDDGGPNEALRLGDPPDDVDPSQPVAIPPTRIVFSNDAPPMRPEEAQEELKTYLYDLAESGKTVVKPSELGEVLFRTGMSGDWLYKHLTRLTLGAQPLLKRVERGYYEILLPEHERVG